MLTMLSAYNLKSFYIFLPNTVNRYLVSKWSLTDFSFGALRNMISLYTFWPKTVKIIQIVSAPDLIVTNVPGYKNGSKSGVWS